MSNPNEFPDKMKRELDRRREETMRKDTTNIKETDPLYGTKDRKEEALDRIEHNLINVNQNLEEIIRLLNAILKKRTISI